MKVLCVSNENFDSGKLENWEEGDPQVGDICTVVKETETTTGIPAYKLLGFGPCVYDKRNFAPLTGRDETETEAYKNLQTVTA